MTNHTEVSHVWAKIKGELHSLLSKSSYDNIVPQLDLIADDGQTLTLLVSDIMQKFWIETNYESVIKQAALLATGAPRALIFEAGDEQVPHHEEAPSQEEKAQKPAQATPIAKPVASAPKQINYTFETFVEYPQNSFALKACQKLAEGESKLLFNPLYIYGKSGVGKSHLLKALAHEFAKQNQHANVILVTGEQFSNEFIEASRTQNFNKLRRKYRKADLLLVDDFQFLAGKEKTLEEFYHTLSALQNAHKTIVLCADSASCDIEKLDSKFVSRIESGLTVELLLPDYEDRLQILIEKRDRAKMEVSDEVLEFIARNIQRSISRLEGALIRVATFTALAGKNIKPEQVNHILRDVLREESTRILSVESIQKRVADYYELKVSDLTGKRRPNSIAFPRQIAMYLSRKLTNNSLKDIGMAFGGRDHGTVIHANKLISSRIAEDTRIRDVVNHLEELLKA